SISSAAAPFRRRSPSTMRARARSAASASASITTTSQPASSSTWAIPAPIVPPPMTAARPPAPSSAMGWILRAGRWPPENGQEAGRPAAPGDEPDEEPGHRRMLEDPGGVVERPLPRPQPGDSKAQDGEGHDVLVALARPEDEEPVLQVV